MASRTPKSANRVLVYTALAVFAVVLAMAASPFTSFGQQGGPAVTAGGEAPADAPIATLELETGTVTIRLRPDLAPNHVERITTLANQGFYDGLTFHRVIPNFMAQTGDPQGTGMGGSDLPNIEAELSSLSFVRGVVGMARAAALDSANSQFFIVTGDSPHLNQGYTAFGEVIEGMEHVDAIAPGAPPNGAVENPDVIVSLRVGGPN